MWHGMPIKSIWRFLPESIEPPRADLLLATSPRFQQIMMQASGMAESSVRVLGLPRNDLLHYKSPHAEHAIHELVGDHRWLLYLPTYRKSKEGYVAEDGCEHDSVLSMSEAEAGMLDAWLQENGIKLIVKAHPMSVHADHCVEQKTAHILVISEPWLVQHQLTLYILAGYSSGLITDLSSIAVDYLLLENPVFIYFPDQAEYVRSRGTVFDDLAENLPGEICPDVASLVAQMSSYHEGQDPGQGRRARLLAEWHSFTAGSAADRLLDAVKV
jgi:CDP-glycerol glycerophosphotransferase (TagB/SpsB family)